MCTKIKTYLFITENPCVPGSIPGGTTYEELLIKSNSFFCFHFIHYLCNVFSKKSMFCLVFHFAQLYI